MKSSWEWKSLNCPQCPPLIQNGMEIYVVVVFLISKDFQSVTPSCSAVLIITRIADVRMCVLQLKNLLNTEMIDKF